MKQSLETLQQKSQVNNNDKNQYNKNIEETNKKLNDLLRQINLPKNIECCEELRSKLEQIQREQKNLVNQEDMRMFKKSWEDLFSRVIMISDTVSKMASNAKLENTTSAEHQRNMQNLIDKMMSNMNLKLSDFDSVINKLENNIKNLDNRTLQTQIQPLFNDIITVKDNIGRIEQLINNKFNSIENKIQINNDNNENINKLLGFFENFNQYIEGQFKQNIEQIFKSSMPESLENKLNAITETVNETKNKISLQLENIEKSKPLALQDFSQDLVPLQKEIENLKNEIGDIAHIDTNYITTSNFKQTISEITKEFESYLNTFYNKIIQGINTVLETKQKESIQNSNRQLQITYIPEQISQQEVTTSVSPTSNSQQEVTTSVSPTSNSQQVTIPLAPPLEQSLKPVKNSDDIKYYIVGAKRKILNKFICTLLKNKNELTDELKCLDDNSIENAISKQNLNDLITIVNDELKKNDSPEKYETLLKLKILLELIFNIFYTKKDEDLNSYISNYIQTYIPILNNLKISEIVNKSSCCMKNTTTINTTIEKCNNCKLLDIVPLDLDIIITIVKKTNEILNDNDYINMLKKILNEYGNSLKEISNEYEYSYEHKLNYIKLVFDRINNYLSHIQSEQNEKSLEQHQLPVPPLPPNSNSPENKFNNSVEIGKKEASNDLLNDLQIDENKDFSNVSIEI
jgi:hypothetical protein